MTRSAIDVGTNSVRLLVVDDTGATLARELAITRLGQGVDATGHLAPEALARTLKAIRGFREIWEGHGSTPPRIAATSAVRDADNRADFFVGILDAAGVPAEVLSGDEEARLAFVGAAGGSGAVEVAWPPVVIDIGGGSTELIVGAGTPASPTVVDGVSLQLGSVRLTERCLAPPELPGGPPSPRQVREAHDVARTLVSEGVAVLLGRGVDVLSLARSGIGVAGTVTTLAQVQLGHDHWRPGRLHGHVLTRKVVEDLANQLATSTVLELAETPGIVAGRRDVIAGGAIILDEVMEVLGLTEIVVSEADILDGLVRA